MSDQNINNSLAIRIPYLLIKIVNKLCLFIILIAFCSVELIIMFVLVILFAVFYAIILVFGAIYALGLGIIKLSEHYKNKIKG
jgi:hypothetical protein